MDNENIENIIESEINNYLSELEQLISYKTIAIENIKSEFDKANKYITKLLKNSGMEEVISINEYENPIIFAQTKQNSSLKTVLLYAHYDVQPAEPLNLWNTDPFKLTIKNDYLYGRGVADDKTLLLSIIKAINIIKNNNLTLKYNVKIVFEPSEECGSFELNDMFKGKNNLEKFKNLFNCDILLACDSSMISAEIPSISTSTRGVIAFEIKIIGPNKDIHSGTYGGIVGNPITELCRLIGNIHDNDNKITIPNFYKNVKNNQENIIDINESEIRNSLDIEDFIHEKGFTLKQSCTTRPTFEINGIFGGYTGNGGKTIIPNSCTAKISCRLVENQTPEEILNEIKNYFKNNIRKGFKYEFTTEEEGGIAVNSDTDSKEFKKFVEILSKEYNKKIAFDKLGGSIPIISKFKNILNCEIIFVGFAFNDSNCHGPNENYSLDSFKKGIKTLVKYLTED